MVITMDVFKRIIVNQPEQLIVISDPPRWAKIYEADIYQLDLTKSLINTERKKDFLSFLQKNTMEVEYLLQQVCESRKLNIGVCKAILQMGLELFVFYMSETLKENPIPIFSGFKMSKDILQQQMEDNP